MESPTERTVTDDGSAYPRRVEAYRPDEEGQPTLWAHDLHGLAPVTLPLDIARPFWLRILNADGAVVQRLEVPDDPSLERPDPQPQPGHTISHATCPHCGSICEVATTPIGRRGPRASDWACCWDCGEVSLYDHSPAGPLVLRKLTAEEAADPARAEVARRFRAARLESYEPLQAARLLADTGIHELLDDQPEEGT